ncbi:MAG: hypothetical protein LBC98_04845 [Prevotellaceae bacterium]|jgi:hypothetical protein|nr:hypothetical protein [Prevotellaceae bacterium]
MEENKGKRRLADYGDGMRGVVFSFFQLVSIYADFLTMISESLETRIEKSLKNISISDFPVEYVSDMFNVNNRALKNVTKIWYEFRDFMDEQEYCPYEHSTVVNLTCRFLDEFIFASDDIEKIYARLEEEVRTEREAFKRYMIENGEEEEEDDDVLQTQDADEEEDIEKLADEYETILKCLLDVPTEVEYKRKNSPRLSTDEDDEDGDLSHFSTDEDDEDEDLSHFSTDDDDEDEDLSDFSTDEDEENDDFLDILYNEDYNDLSGSSISGLVLFVKHMLSLDIATIEDTNKQSDKYSGKMKHIMENFDSIESEIKKGNIHLLWKKFGYSSPMEPFDILLENVKLEQQIYSQLSESINLYKQQFMILMKEVERHL